jgi:hypothetical protein
MRGPVAVAASLLFLVLAGGMSRDRAQAQIVPPSPPAEDDSSVVTELAPVQVNLPGPALWRVSRGDSQVIILGFVRPLPHGLDWPKGRLLHALDGAHALLVPPEPTLGVLDTVGLLLSLGRLQNPQGRTLAQVLAPGDYQAYAQAVARSHLPAKHYDRYKPVVAGAALIGDVRRAEGLSSEKPVSTVQRMARQLHVRIQPMGRLKAAPLLRIVVSLDDGHGLACFREEMAEIAWETTDARAAAEAWGRGDVASLRRLKSRVGVIQCLEDLPSIQALTERGTADAVTAIDEALSRPGKTVALVDLTYLDRTNGLLDRLKARGATISVPE